MKNYIFRTLILINIIISNSLSINILGIFPYEGRSHHIFFSPLIQELALRNHNVTVVNYLPMKETQNFKQILLDKVQETDKFNVEEFLQPTFFGLYEFYKVYETVKRFQVLANSNCEKLVKNRDLQRIVKEEKFDVVIVEQFITDCGFGIAHQVKAPVVGMTAHEPMPWTYARLGAPNNPSFVRNHFFASGSTPSILNRIKGVLINTFFELYNRYYIQTNDTEIVKRVYPNTPNLEELGLKTSLLLTNQYYPLTGSRVQGSNVVEIGGMHIKETQDLKDVELKNFLNNAVNGVVYISFGSTASNLPRKFKDTLINIIRKSNLTFLWKADDVHIQDVPKNNTLIRRWLSQTDLLCHPNVKVFITHSGMLSSTEAIHCGVPIVSIPLYGDQFTNAKSAEEAGLGVMLDVFSFDETVVAKAIETVLQERYQNRAKQLSRIWKDRPMSPLDTAVYWVEYVAKYKDNVNLRPPSVDVPLYQYLMIDLFLIFGLILAIIMYIPFKIVSLIISKFSKTLAVDMRKKQT